MPPYSTTSAAVSAPSPTFTYATVSTGALISATLTRRDTRSLGLKVDETPLPKHFPFCFQDFLSVTIKTV
jgi:hypothetical protein